MANLCVTAMPAVAASGNVTAETAFGYISNGSVRAFTPAIQYPNGIDGRIFVLRYGVLVTTGTSSTYGPSIRLYSGGNTALTTFTNDTAMITPSAPTIATTTKLITIEAHCTWDSTTAHLNGFYALTVDATFTTWAVLTATLTSGVATQGAVMFFPTGIFGSTNGSNTAVVKYFEIDLL